MTHRCLSCDALIATGSRCPACSKRFTQKRGPSGWDRQRASAAIRERDGGCVHAHLGACDGPLRVDHIKPLSEGGSDEAWNKRTLCLRHHRDVTPGGGG